MDDTPNPWHGVSIDKSPAKWFSRIVFYIRWVNESLQAEEGFHMKSLKLVDLTSNCPKRGSQLWKKHLKAQYRYQKCYIYTTYMCIYTDFRILQFVRLPVNFRASDSGSISQNVKRIGFPGNLTNPMKSFNQLKSLGGSSLPGCKVAAGSPALKKPFRRAPTTRSLRDDFGRKETIVRY